MTKKSGQKFKNLENKKTFRDEVKLFSIIFKGLAVVKNCIRPKRFGLELAIFRFTPVSMMQSLQFSS